MFVCENCGDSQTDWCEICGKAIACDHRDKTYTRFKDLIYDCEKGERTVTIRLHHCETCGEVSHAEV